MKAPSVGRESLKSIVLQGQTIQYVLRPSSRRRSIGFKIDADGLSVATPIWVKEPELEQALHHHANWIFQKLKAWAERVAQSPPLQFDEGDLLWWLGTQIPIRLVSMQDALPRPLSLDEIAAVDHILIWEGCTERQAAVNAWYAAQALPWFKYRTQHFAARLGRYPKAIKVSQARGRWGSCNRSGIIRLNWRLMQASPAEIDYVVAHELAHLVHMNHSQAFWNTVEQIHPHWKPISQVLTQRDGLYRQF